MICTALVFRALFPGKRVDFLPLIMKELAESLGEDVWNNAVTLELEGLICFESSDFYSFIFKLWRGMQERKRNCSW